MYTVEGCGEVAPPRMSRFPARGGALLAVRQASWPPRTGNDRFVGRGPPPLRQEATA